ncbi:alpha/beta fold hydrolase [Paraburkholderia phymatum]|uniref:Alpha/beta fold hydrolase n=1 Tax=Paraburkholderia phymatum TaxID=148447 RepID=A0ACC6U919_9BURK
MLVLISLLLVALLLAVFLLWLKLVAPVHPVFMLLSIVSGLLKPTDHAGKPTPRPELLTPARYPATTPPPNTASKHGEIEYLDDGTQAIHWYAEVAGVTFHLVTAGNPAWEPVLMLHGLPESWWAFHNQISDLSKDHYVIALDLKGYGQSDKRLTLDYTNATMAREIASLLDKLGIGRFNLVSHDRGTIIADHMTSVPSLNGRILRYVRMQQSFDEPHGLPEPPHALFKSKLGEALFKSKNLIPLTYIGMFQSGIRPSVLKRLDYEFKFRGVAGALRKYFETTNLAIELKDRHNFLFKAMTMPVLILQGRYDKGQHPSEYARSADFGPKIKVQVIEASHFSHLENPVAVNAAIRAFFQSAKVNS